jgi:putative oxidoreductase
MEAGLLLIRVVLGGIMAAHGSQKLFGWFGGPGLAGTEGWLESMGFKPARLHAVVVGLAEFGGGALLALGLLTPLGAAAIAGVMFVAIATVHWSNGFFNGSGGYEFNHDRRYRDRPRDHRSRRDLDRPPRWLDPVRPRVGPCCSRDLRGHRGMGSSET